MLLHVLIQIMSLYLEVLMHCLFNLFQIIIILLRVKEFLGNIIEIVISM